MLVSLLKRALNRALNRAYLWYKDHAPVARGKYRLGWLLQRLIGPTRYVRDGLRLELNAVSGIDEKLIRGEAHDPVVTEQIAKHVRPGDVVIDLGANIGIFTLQASRAVGPEGRVYAFEPSPREYVRLLRHIELNGCTNVVPIASGVADIVRDEIIHLAWMGNPGQNSLYAPGNVERAVRCHLGPLGNFVSEWLLPRVTLVKVDVEGAEMLVLRGAASIMPKLTNATWVVEVVEGNLSRCGETPAAIYDFFAAHGYRPMYGLGVAVQDEVFTRGGT